MLNPLTSKRVYLRLTIPRKFRRVANVEAILLLRAVLFLVSRSFFISCLGAEWTYVGNTSSSTYTAPPLNYDPPDPSKPRLHLFWDTPAEERKGHFLRSLCEHQPGLVDGLPSDSTPTIAIPIILSALFTLFIIAGYRAVEKELGWDTPAEEIASPRILKIPEPEPLAQVALVVENVEIAEAFCSFGSGLFAGVLLGLGVVYRSYLTVISTASDW